MTPQQAKKLLVTKQIELKSRQVRWEDIEIVKNSEVLDDIQQSCDRTLVLDSLTRNWEMASLVSAALQRVEHGTYGTCAECDEPISPKRLAALPWAQYCIECQQRADASATELTWAEAA